MCPAKKEAEASGLLKKGSICKKAAVQKTGLETTRIAGYENTALHLLVKIEFTKRHLTNIMFPLIMC